MFSLGIEMRYWLYSEPTDMRKRFHTLTGLVTNRIGADARNGDVYVFINKRRNRVKLLHYEKGGMVIYPKMLDRGTFGMPLMLAKEGAVSYMKWDDLRKIASNLKSNKQLFVNREGAMDLEIGTLGVYEAENESIIMEYL